VIGIAAEQRTGVMLDVVAKSTDIRKPIGFAPLAARSDKFIRSALRPIFSGGSSGKKCTPAMTPSVVSTRSQSSGGVTMAASSSRPKAPGAVASGRK
jgi:hypothetical protein